MPFFGTLGGASNRGFRGYGGISTLSASYLVVAGGGGSTSFAGGGGGGGVLSGTSVFSFSTNYAITVGLGGAGGSGQQTIGANGGNSSVSGTGITTITAIGGGGGAARTNAVTGANGYSGGSGGGGSPADGAPQGIGGAGTAGQGFAGGNGAAYGWGGGGGGGAGANGSVGVGSTSGGNGGIGIASSISGTSTYYGGGGGGSNYNNGTAGTGGLGGGGAGTGGGGAGTSGTPSTGGGGGSGGYSTGAGGSGGSGIVILSYPGTQPQASAGSPRLVGSNTVHTFTANGTFRPLSGTGDVYFKYNTLLLHGTGTNAANNNTIVDSSATPKTITRNGNVKPGSISPFSLNGGWSNYFNGSTDYLTTPAGSDFAFGTGDFTVEAWVYQIARTSYGQIAGCHIYGTSADWFFTINSSGYLFFQITSSATGAITSTSTVPLNAWTHVAVVRISGTVTIYINGVNAGGSGSYATSITNASTPFSIGGASNGNAASLLTGYLSNVRVVKGTALYTTAFTPSTTPLTAISGTSLLTCQSNRFVDTNSSPKTFTVNGTPTVQAFNPFGRTTAYSTSTETGSLYFDGTGDSLTIASPASALIDWYTSSFTVEYWIYPNSFNTGGNGSDPVTIGNMNITDTSNYWSFGPLSSGVVRFYYYNGSIQGFSTTATIPLNTWTHLAFVNNAGSLTIYINGVSSATATIVGTPVSSSGSGVPLAIGKAGSVAFTGLLSNIRITGSAVYTTAFTPSTTPLTAISGTALLLKGTDAGIYDSTGLNNLETISTTQISTTQSKYGGSSIYFNGSSYLSVPTSSNFGFGTADFTIETWIYPTSNAGTGIGPIAEFRTAIAAQATAIRINASNQIHFYDGPANVDTIFTTVVATLNVWQHIAIVRYSNVVYAYINGVLAGSVAVTSNLGSTQPILIGSLLNAGYIYTGYMSDLRITKGVARYTAAFTPPTATLLDTISR